MVKSRQEPRVVPRPCSFSLCASQCSSAGPRPKHHSSEHEKTSNSPDTPPSKSSPMAPYTQNAEEREIPALQGIRLRERGHRQEMLAGLSTNVSAAGACIVWLEGVGFSQREGMSRSISDSKRHSLKPATQLSFISTGRSEQLLPGICQQVRSSRIFPHPTEERLQMMCRELALQTFGWFFHASPSRPQEPQAPRLWKLKLVYLPLCIWDTRI